MKTETYVLPLHWASALINGDESGLTEEEVLEIKDFCRNLGSCLDMADENEFSWTNDANSFGGAVATFHFRVLE